jgi:hypothetical protein
MPLELTEQQRQAVEGSKGLEPVEVVDPASNRAYVLLARDLYERVRHLLERQERPVEAAARPEPAPEPPEVVRPLRQRMRDLPMPPAVATFAVQWGKQIGLFGRKGRQDLEDQLKLQHYYGGMWIAYLRTKEGPVVVAAADSLNNPSFDRQLSFLTADERRRKILSSPPVLFDEQSEILTPFSDES